MKTQNGDGEASSTINWQFIPVAPLLAPAGRSACSAARLRDSCGPQGVRDQDHHLARVYINTLYPLCGERGDQSQPGSAF